MKIKAIIIISNVKQKDLAETNYKSKFQLLSFSELTSVKDDALQQLFNHSNDIENLPIEKYEILLKGFLLASVASVAVDKILKIRKINIKELDLNLTEATKNERKAISMIIDSQKDELISISDTSRAFILFSPEQYDILRARKSVLVIRGTAGSGKTLILMHKTYELLRSSEKV